MSLRSKRNRGQDRRHRNRASQVKDALPIPIFHGAKVIRITSNHHTDDHHHSYSVTDFSKPLPSEAYGVPHRASCKPEIRSGQPAELVSPRSETSDQVKSDQDLEAQSTTRQVGAAQLALVSSSTAEVPYLLHPGSQASKSFLKTHPTIRHLPHPSSQQTGIVINRAAIPEPFDVSSKDAGMNLSLAYACTIEESPSRRQPTKSGRADSEDGAERNSSRSQSQSQRSQTQSLLQSPSRSPDHQEDAAQQVSPSARKHLLPLDGATIASVSNEQVTVDAAAPHPHPHQDSTLKSLLSRTATTKWGLNTDQSLVNQDLLHKPAGDQSTSLTPPPSPSPQQRVQGMPAETIYKELGDLVRQHSVTDLCLETDIPATSSRMRLGRHSAFQDQMVPLPTFLESRRRTTMSDMVKKSFQVREREGTAMSPDIPLHDLSMTDLPASDDLESPVSYKGSDLGSDFGEEQYSTPLTSPCSSPPKQDCPPDRIPPNLRQIDGEVGSDDRDLSGQDAGVGAATARARVESAVRDALDLRDDEDVFSTPISRSSVPPLSRILQDDTINHARIRQRQYHDDVEGGDDLETPLGPASPAKLLGSFPFPNSSSEVNDVLASGKTRTPSRHPSALLRHCERSATPRQQRLIMGGVRSPDRFITSRAATPTKEGLILGKHDTLSKHQSPTARRRLQASIQDDPFGPSPRRSLRMVEQYATVRSPPPALRSVGMTGSRVQDAHASRSAPSAGTIWTVGGSLVTEGVASTTTGRGGRVTSGTSAPHYTADFLRKDKPSEEEVLHGKRLAVAMEISPRKSMMDQGSSPVSNGSLTTDSSPGSSNSGGKRVWRDGVWEIDGVATPTKSKMKKAKDVPVIPFRVLDAPALRDDYYCSLLAYSHSVQCLAVGLGPHVYLWSEARAANPTIPDSLTAPLGTAHVTSVSFSSREGDSAILAIGRADGRITLWSPLDRDPRFDSEQPAPVSCVCFRPNTVRRTSMRDGVTQVPTEQLLVGDEMGYVYYYSIEWPNQHQRDLFDWHGSMTLLARLSCHSQQVCGMAWSGDGEVFATGGNDNQLFLFESKKILKPSLSSRGHEDSASGSPPVRVRHGSGSASSSNATVNTQREVLHILPNQAKQTFTLNAAVKALAFAPWQPSLLAAGGGSNDRCIHFFHTLSGASLATIDCHAQVTSLVWSSKRKEIAATFGFAQPEHPYRVAVFSWPSCSMVVGIPWWGEERALYSVAYPRGPSGGGAGRADAEGRPWYGRRTREEGCLVVATSDASIKFHEIWAEREGGDGKTVAGGPGGVLGGSQILEGVCLGEVEGREGIR